MASDLKGKIVLITGAGSGIGRATAVKLHSLGAHLALTDLNLDGVRETHRLCGGAQEHYAAKLDVSNKDEVEASIAAVLAHFSGRNIDHVFNCAGVNPTSYALTDTTDAYWALLVDVNLKGTYLVTRAAMPHMTAPGGSFVNVSSICGLHPVANQAIYCATKYGIIGFSKSMALELGPKGIRCNAVAPGYIDTPTNAGVVKGPEYVKRMEQGNSLGRLGTPEEIADVVAFLMSAEARYMNGSVVEIDGGLKA
ncbi:3-oxoacyl-(acyl-carrier-protein) reductase FabG [Lasiodiplodia hormozganensis]|uniref:3-oxoacyl-(Acyl-carrier-protein) reductase FabG n=1 Tax=Lasiodiplodia hormozganensis TaxID=869390 RepID=A0AA40CU94_9PEZI|nr:3-oxoacyl-(acyl-carrier-protein) reductase FabG [Lasiodiplodia hormozganensis]